ncbi:DUF2125 domain-containing protein [uncultured Sulfitobacter sp.]|uniref:DUF2125 domain-containing protein n=1 Tax=uncultured Sulfitobacter sp. TaxID=191468 RepID=UPI00263408B0|nr:DUF2125 domain-containing protein [uncultured Sulfitobacter sp.]
MSLTRSYIATTALGLTLFATTASADLTAGDVWGDWRGYLEGMGYTVTATEAAEAGALLVSGISVASNGGAATDAITVRIGDLQFVENNDGSVAIVMPSEMPITIDVTNPAPQPLEQIGALLTQTGQVMTVRGDASALVYDYTADTFGLALTSLTEGGAPLDDSSVRFSLTGTALASKTNVTVSDTRSYTQTMQIGSIAYDLFMQEEGESENISINSALSDLSFRGISNMPMGDVSQTQDVAALLAQGFAVDGTFNANGTETQIEVTSDEGTTKIKTGTARSTFGIAMDTQGVRYDVSADQVQMGGQLAGLPFPLFVEMAKYGFELRAPVAKSDDPQDFKLAFNMTDFTMSDIIWALFDASAQLPRDPATVAIDLSGKAKVLVDGLSPQNAQQLAMTGAAPAELNALKIDRLLVDALGAKVEATGDITFDNIDTTTMAGIPKPVGDININIAGANELMDKLTAIGMLPAEQAMGARMMMGLFAVPGAAPDTLTSKIEFNDAGQILANGQRIK